MRRHSKFTPSISHIRVDDGGRTWYILKLADPSLKMSTTLEASIRCIEKAQELRIYATFGRQAVALRKRSADGLHIAFRWPRSEVGGRSLELETGTRSARYPLSLASAQ